MKIRALPEPVELTISIRFFFPPFFFFSHPSFLTLIVHAFILLIVLMLHVLSHRLKNNGARNSKQQEATEQHNANMKALEIRQK